MQAALLAIPASATASAPDAVSAARIEVAGLLWQDSVLAAHLRDAHDRRGDLIGKLREQVFIAEGATITAARAFGGIEAEWRQERSVRLDETSGDVVLAPIGPDDPRMPRPEVRYRLAPGDGEFLLEDCRLGKAIPCPEDMTDAGGWTYFEGLLRDIDHYGGPLEEATDAARWQQLLGRLKVDSGRRPALTTVRVRDVVTATAAARQAIATVEEFSREFPTQCRAGLAKVLASRQSPEATAAMALSQSPHEAACNCLGYADPAPRERCLEGAFDFVTMKYPRPLFRLELTGSEYSGLQARIVGVPMLDGLILRPGGVMVSGEVPADQLAALMPLIRWRAFGAENPEGP